MEDKYKYFSASEFAGEESFILWVIKGEHHSAWTQWLNEHPEKTEILKEAKEIVRTLASIKTGSIDEHTKNELWARIKSGISADAQRIPIQKQFRLLRWSLAGAAVLALLIWFNSSREVNNVIVRSGEKKEITLPENSMITVNAGSKVRYNKKLFVDDREITLEGEAFFKVNPGSTFTVTTPQGTVTVMGTSFNVISRPGRFEVSCYTGKVRIIQGPNDKAEITKGEKCYSSKMKEKLKLKTFDASSSSPEWTRGKFTFDDQPLSVVVGELERQYGVKVNLSSGIEDIRYTGLFESGDLEKALSLITWPLHLKTEISGKTISISR